MTSGAGDAPAPGHGPSVMDMLEHSQVAPLLHMPVGDILAHLKLPPLPQLPPLPPLPQLPPLPTIDLAQLFKPLTDLLAGFGSGNMASAPFDPTQLFSGLQQAFESVFSLGSQAMSTLMPLWTGPAATETIAKGVAANTNGAHTGAQSGDISRIVAVATATVGKGLALLEGVIASFAASIATFIPFALTPVGQAGIIASATTHLTSGLAVVADTRAELTAHTANMSITAAPVAITAAPQVAAQVPGLAMSSVQAVTSPIQSIVGAVGGLGARGGATLAGRADRDLASARTSSSALGDASGSGSGAGGAGLGGGVGGIGGLGGAGAAGTGSSPLSQRSPSDPGLGGPRSVGAGSAGRSDEETVVTKTSGATTAPAAMPMGGAGAAGASPSSSTHTADRMQSVDARHTEEVVGDVPAASPTVLGGVEPPVGQSIWESPDELDE